MPARGSRKIAFARSLLACQQGRPGAGKTHVEPPGRSRGSVTSRYALGSRVRRAAAASALLIPALILTGAPAPAPSAGPPGASAGMDATGRLDPGRAFSPLDVGADDPVTDRSARSSPAGPSTATTTAVIERSQASAGDPPIDRKIDRTGTDDDRSKSTRAVRRVRAARTYTPRHAAGSPVVSGTVSSTAVEGVGAEVAVLFALAQVGKAYVYGATGPNAYDCSGLVVAAFRHAGVTLPRTTGGMRSAGRHVERSQMRRGDVLWFEGGGHVAIYLGDGMIVHAANERTDVLVGRVYETPVEVRRMIG